MASQGPNLPGTASTDNSVGVISWSDIDQIKNDTSNTIASVYSGSGSYQKSEYIKGTNYGFTIPTGSTINGIEVTIEEGRNNYALAYEDEVKIIKANGAYGTQNKATNTLSTALNVYTLGGASDLWGEAWTASDINDTDFGVALSVKVLTVFKYPAPAFVGYIKIKVYYTEGVSAAVKTIAGIAVANIKTIMGIVIGNVKSYFGITK